MFFARWPRSRFPRVYGARNWIPNCALASAGGRGGIEELPVNSCFRGTDERSSPRISPRTYGLFATGRRAGPVNRATRNNVFVVLPQNVISSISGPVIGTNNTGTVWGSALGAFVSWEPFDFGLRQANVATAAATKAQAESSLKRSQFEIAAAISDAYLTLAAAQEMVHAAQAGVERAETVVRMTDALVNVKFGPGAGDPPVRKRSSRGPNPTHSITPSSGGCACDTSHNW